MTPAKGYISDERIDALVSDGYVAVAINKDTGAELRFKEDDLVFDKTKIKVCSGLYIPVGGSMDYVVLSLTGQEKQ